MHDTIRFWLDYPWIVCGVGIPLVLIVFWLAGLADRFVRWMMKSL